METILGSMASTSTWGRNLMFGLTSLRQRGVLVIGFGLKTHLVELDENYFAIQYFVDQDSHL